MLAWFPERMLWPWSRPCPQNNSEYASAAAQAGADAIMVGIDKTDTSLPGLFGSFDLMEESIDSILSTTSVPVGHIDRRLEAA